MIKNKILIIIMVFIMLMIPIKSFASAEIDDVINDGDIFMNHAKDPSTVINVDDVKKVSGDIYNIVFAVGLVIDVVVGLIIGIKFMISTVEEKAKVKEILTIYIIGSIVLFGSFTIWKITMGILGNV